MNAKRYVINMIGLATLAALAIPGKAAAEEYKLDPVHTRIGFVIGHLGIGRIRGAFTNYTGTVVYKKGETHSIAAEATIQANSVDTRWAARDEHLRSADFLDAKKFPEIRFKADKMETKDGKLYLVGEFTLHGVTRMLRLPMTISGPIADPWGNRRIGVSATATINRHDYGVGTDKDSDKMVGNEVTLEIELEAVVQQGQ